MTLGQLAILGGGAVARALGPRLAAAGVDVRAWTRDPEAAAAVGRPVSLEELAGADAAWILVSDRAIAEVAARLAEAGAPPVVLHGSGYHGSEVLAPLASAERGVLHPLVSFPNGRTPDLGGAGAALSGAPAAREVASELARALGLEPFEVPDTPGGRARYHAAAALTANGVAALFDLALAALPPEVDRAAAQRALAHLTRGVLAHVAEQGPGPALTGPVVRGDAEVVGGHLEALPEEAGAVYRLLVRRMLAMADLDSERAAAIAALLGE